MKNSNHKKSRIIIILLRMLSYSVILLFSYSVMHSCDSIYDNVEKYADGEIVYIDKLDGILKVQIGYERVEIDLLETGRIPASQINMAKATKTVIECPDFTEPGHRRVIDSICSWVNVTGLTQLKYYELTVYTEDELGNRSLPMKTSVKPYTEENLNTLEITPPTINASSSAAQIEWINGISALTHQALSYEWQYTDRDGVVCTDGDEGDKPVIFLENVAAETDIPVRLKCRVIPTIGNPDYTYTPIIDTVDFLKTLYFRLSSNANEVIFLKTPAPGIDKDLMDELPLIFAWTKSAAVNSGYTLKFSLSPSFPESETISLNAGDNNEYLMNNTEMLDLVNSLKASFMSDVYWTVTPTVQGAPVKTSFRLLKVLKAGVFYEYDRTGWEVIDFSSIYPGYLAQNIFDGDLSTLWHSNNTAFPHFLLIDLKTSLNIYKFDIFRRLDAGQYGDTKTVELYLGDSPQSSLWTKIGDAVFSTAGYGEDLVEALTTDNVTKGRYLRLLLPDSYRVGSTYVNIAEIYLYYQDK